MNSTRFGSCVTSRLRGQLSSALTANFTGVEISRDKKRGNELRLYENDSVSAFSTGSTVTFTSRV
jgi:hypothetical protein